MPKAAAQEEQPDDNLRLDIEAAFDAVEKPDEEPEHEEEGRSEEDTEEPVGAAETEDTDEPDDEEELVTEEPEEEPEEEDLEALAEDLEKQAQQPEERAPVSWRAKARESWSKVPPEARAEITRRENEVTQALQRSTQARQFQDTFARVVQPYMPYIQAEGADPLQATKSLLDVAATLHAAPPRVKAETIAQLVQRYGVDIKELDDVLSARVGPQGDLVSRAVQQAVAPYQQMLQRQAQASQTQAQSVQQEVMSELEQFASDPKNEFFHDVKEDMASLLEAAGRRGQTLSLKDAYTRALKLNPEVSEILDMRRRAAEARQRAQKAQEKKRAASSIKGVSSNASRRVKVEEGISDLRSDIAEAFSLVESKAD